MGFQCAARAVRTGGPAAADAHRPGLLPAFGALLPCRRTARQHRPGAVGPGAQGGDPRQPGNGQCGAQAFESRGAHAARREDRRPVVPYDGGLYECTLYARLVGDRRPVERDDDAAHHGARPAGTFGRIRDEFRFFEPAQPRLRRARQARRSARAQYDAGRE